MKKIILMCLVAVSTMFAGDTAKEVDLLSKATKSEVVGTTLALASSEAKDVKAGYYSRYSRYNRYRSYTSRYSSSSSRSSSSYIYASHYWNRWGQ